MSKVWNINFQITVNGSDISDYIVSAQGKASLCHTTGDVELELRPGIPTSINPYDDVIIWIDGVKVFTGFAQNEVKARRPASQTLTCRDPMIKVADTWLAEEWESHGESIDYWIRRFLDLSGVSHNVAGGMPPAPEKVFSYLSAKAGIDDLLKFVDAQVSVNASGVIQVVNHALSVESAITLNELLTFDRHRSDEWYRNRIVVYGVNQEATVDVTQYIDDIDGEVRTAVFASPDIIWPGTAHRIAEIMLREFSTPLDVITVEIEGNPNIRVGSSVRVQETWSGTDEYGVVTSYQWRIDDDGYVSVVVINEKCPAYWFPPDVEPDILYCATEGEGVWKSFNNGRDWFDISGTELSKGLPSYVKDIHVIKGVSLIGTDDVVWAATLGGIFRTNTGSPPWTDITSKYMDYQGNQMDWWGVLTDPIETEKVYCVGNYDAIYMYVSLDNGLTWSKYQVNPTEDD